MQTTTNAHARVTDRPLAVVHESGTAWLALGDLTIFPPRENGAFWLRLLADAALELAAQVEESTRDRRGDGCQLLGDYRVRHVDCVDHPAGTVTDVRTGKVVAS